VATGEVGLELVLGLGLDYAVGTFSKATGSLLYGPAVSLGPFTTGASFLTFLSIHS